MKSNIDRKILRVLIVSVITLSNVVMIIAQEPAKATKKTKIEEEIEKKSVSMLYSLIDEAQNLQLPMNRAKVLMSIADMLWNHDEKKARELIDDSIKIFHTLPDQNDDEDEDAVDGDSTYSWKIMEIRRDIIQKSAKHDPDFAIKFQISSRAIIEKLPEYQKIDEQQPEATIAYSVAQSDPKRAVQLAKEYINTNDNIVNLDGTVQSLYEKDPESARSIVDLIINKSKSDTKFDYETLFFLNSLLNSAASSDEQANTTEKAKSSINRQQARELTELILKRIQTKLAEKKTSNDPDPMNDIVILPETLPNFEEHVKAFSPESMELFKKLQKQSNNIIDRNNPHQKRMNEFQEIANNSSAEKIAELAISAAPELQYHYYNQAISKFLDEGNIEQARKVANEQIPSPAQREMALRTIKNHILQNSIVSKKFDDARSSIKTLKTKTEKVNAYIQLAQTLLSANDKVLAEEILNEAYSLVSGHPKSFSQFMNQLKIAFGYAGINPSRSFDIVESTINKCNELLDASLLVAEFDQTGAVNNGEMLVSGNNESSYFSQYLSILPLLFHSDAARTESILNKINRNDARTVVKLSLLQQLLGTGENTFNGDIESNQIITKRSVRLMQLLPGRVTFRSN